MISKLLLTRVDRRKHSYRLGLMAFRSLGGRIKNCIVNGSSAHARQPRFEALENELRFDDVSVVGWILSVDPSPMMLRVRVMALADGGLY